MSAEMTHSQAVELLPLYALGVLEPEEMEALDRLIAISRELKIELRKIEDTLWELPYALPDEPFPEDGASRLMARLQADIPALTLRDSDTSTAKEPLTTAAAEQSANPSFLDRLRNGLWQPNRWTAIATTAALLLLLLYVSQLRTELHQTRAELDAIHEAVSVLQETDNLIKQEMKIIANAEQVIKLQGIEEPQARGTYHLSEREGVLVITNLPALSDNQVYQMWLVSDGHPISAGLLSISDPDIPTAKVVMLPPDVQTFDAFDISIEAAEGNSTLEGPIVLQWKEE